MAHHLAELLHQSRTLEGTKRAKAEKAAADLILRLWSQRETLPGAVYPLKDLEKALSVLRLLDRGASPFSPLRSRTDETLLADAFDGLRQLVVHGILLLSSRLEVPVADSHTAPFLADEERRVLEAMNLWAAHFEQARRSRMPIVEFVSGTTDAKADAEPEVLTEEAIAKRVFVAEIDKLQATLAALRGNIGADK